MMRKHWKPTQLRPTLPTVNLYVVFPPGILGILCALLVLNWGFPGGSDDKESACNAGDLGSIPESGRSPGEGNGNLLQCSCLEDPMNRGAWQATVHGVAKSQT